MRRDRVRILVEWEQQRAYICMVVSNFGPRPKTNPSADTGSDIRAG